jgi:hypothetical protein
MGCNSCQASYIFKPRGGKHFTHVASSDTNNAIWNLQVKAAVRILCSSLVSTRKKTNLMVIFLQDSLVKFYNEIKAECLPPHKNK